MGGSESKFVPARQPCSSTRVDLSQAQPALRGRQVILGWRQSIPSSMQASCAEEIATDPAGADGQTKRPCSSRLA